MLFGDLKANTVSNKKVGPPIDRDGKVLMHEGVPQTSAQPPFLLRYSPMVFAEEAPAMFSHDPETNRDLATVKTGEDVHDTTIDGYD